MEAQPPKVFIGLSGGVDSSVSAALLKKAGYAVTGVFIKVWQPDFFECAWKDDRLDAKRVCAKLGIPFIELNLEKEYKKEVVDYMIREYKAGRTPNPDVMCNSHIKFGAFYDWGRKHGADYIATGHYARVQAITKLAATNYKLLTGLDANKDQSYFLWQLRQEQLSHILFPVGGMKKSEVRKLAKKFGLITAEKKDSQGLCFVGKVDIKEFLSHFIKPKKGKVLDEEGKVIGEHGGAAFFTLGERHGFTADADFGASMKARYVVAKDIKKNTLTVSPDPKISVADGSKNVFEVGEMNWIGDAPAAGASPYARLRYRQPLQAARIIGNHPQKSGLSSEQISVRFTQAQSGGAPGQSIVFYDGERCLGGGVIRQKLNTEC